jgi:hypothetical protein
MKMVRYSVAEGRVYLTFWSLSRKLKEKFLCVLSASAVKMIIIVAAIQKPLRFEVDAFFCL